MKLRGNLMLMAVAIIWGSALVAQQTGMEHIGPFTYTGIRFLLGAITLLPLLFYFSRKREENLARESRYGVYKIGCLVGIVMCAAVSFQQVGLQYTSVGKAAFITCLYIVLVPVFGLFFKQKIRLSTGVGAVVALFGLYLLCVKDGFTMEYGDILMLVSSLFWTLHILLVGRYANAFDPIQLSFCQFIACAVSSGMIAVFTEEIIMANIFNAAMPLLYGGILCSGVGFTLQVIGQKYAEPANAAVILSMETVFGALAGYLFLSEVLGSREVAGCIVMLLGMLLTQLGGMNLTRRKVKCTGAQN